MVESNISANEKNKFSVSLLAFWVKGSIIADNNFVHIDMPNTVLFGLIPAGKNKKSIPLQSISNAEESNWYKIANMIFGLVLVLLGILLFLTGFKFRMTIERNSGVTESIDVPFFEGEKIRNLVSEINESVASYQQSSNYRDYGAQNTQAIINAMNANTQTQQVNNVASNPVQPNSVDSNDSTGQFCPNCGTKNAGSASFCTHCGTKLVNN